MKTRTVVTVLVALFIFSPGSHAQVGRLLKKIGEEATKGLAEEKKEEVKPSVDPTSSILKMLGNSDVKYDDNYEFTTAVRMELTSFDESGKVESVVEFTSLINTMNSNSAVVVKPVDGSSQGSQPASMIFISDMVNQTSLMLTESEGSKNAIATSMAEESYDETSSGDEEVDEVEDPSDMASGYRKTGRTKTIAGYRCEEYRYEDEEYIYNVWVTDDIKNRPGRKELSKAGMPVYYGGPFDGGMMMESETIEGGKRTSLMVVTDVRVDTRESISMAGWSVIGIGAGK